jgi:hypothetical protein
MSRSKRNAAAADYFNRAPGYSAEAIEDLRSFADLPLVREADDTRWFVLELAAHLAASHKFALPRGGRLFGDDISEPSLSSFRLPFGVAAFEFEAPAPPPARTQSKGFMTISEVPKRIALCVDWEEWSVPFPLKDRIGASAGCVVWPIGLRTVNGRQMWLPEHHGLSVAYAPGTIVNAAAKEQSQSLRDAGIIHENGRPYTVMNFTIPCKYVSLGQFGRDALRELSEAQRAIAIQLDTRDEITSVIQACAALACTNVTTEVVRPNREARAASPASTLFDYHILMIDPGKERNPSEDRGGTHASPRTHLRRGHIRRLAWGPRIWVNSCVVNPTAIGTVNKDYVVIPPKKGRTA